MGILSSIFKAIPIIGDVASGIENGRQAGRQAEADANYKRDQLALSGARLNLEAPGMRAGNSVRGDVLAGAQPLTINGPITHTGGQMPQISGGLSPSLFSNNTRQLGQNMSRQALLSQMKGDAFTPTALPKANWLDKILNGVGYAGLGKGVYDQFNQRETNNTYGEP